MSESRAILRLVCIIVAMALFLGVWIHRPESVEGIRYRLREEVLKVQSRSTIHNLTIDRALISDESVVLSPNSFLTRGDDFVSSPSGSFRAGLSDSGDLRILDRTSNIVWSSSPNITPRGYRLYMQGDGNLLIRDSSLSALWDSKTYGNNGARLVLNDDGILSVKRGDSELWVSQAADSIQRVLGSDESIVLSPNSYLTRGDDLVTSPSGLFRAGLSDSGDLTVFDSTSSPVWSSGTVNRGHRMYMQGDGNLLIRDDSHVALWNSRTYGNNGARLVLNDAGILMVKVGNTQLWASPPPQSSAQSTGQALNLASSTGAIEQSTVLVSGGSFSRGDFFSSPSGGYSLGLSNDGEFELRGSGGQNDVIWSAGISTGYRVFMQTDGNLIVRDVDDGVQWNSATSEHDGAQLIIDDGGQVAVEIPETGARLWLEGVPRGSYQTPAAAEDLQFPIRGAFYYTWYPETWTVNGHPVKFEPTLGYYSLLEAPVAEKHIEMLDYAHINLSIASWWGPGQNLDKARITHMMDKTQDMNSNIKWTVYHEEENHHDSNPADIRRELDYLKYWFAWHPTWAHIDRRPVIFVYNDEEGCQVATRWMAASQGEWYVVLKAFPGFFDCPVQPDSWHQYGPAEAEVHIAGYTYSISPGFWLADSSSPLLPRQTRQQWRAIVQNMVDSGEPWQLVTTFNEAGEGTMVETAREWASSSGYGVYLDGLNYIH